MNDTKTKQNPPRDFEDGINELEHLVDKIEGSDINLEESLQLYERAQYLSTWCMDFLEKAEQRIKVLLPKTDGTFELDDFKKQAD